MSTVIIIIFRLTMASILRVIVGTYEQCYLIIIKMKMEGNEQRKECREIGMQRFSHVSVECYRRQVDINEG